MAWLVRYGRPAFVGAFASPAAFDRGVALVVETSRGLEVGELLGTAPDGEADGRILRPASHDDETKRAAADALARRILAAAAERIEPVGALVLDCEVLLDASLALLHIVAWEPIDLSSALHSLELEFAVPIRLYDVGQSPVAPDPTSCGKPNCGSGGCGSCGSGGCGSCSRGSVSPDELTGQFRELREAMERDALAGRRELL